MNRHERRAARARKRKTISAMSDIETDDLIRKMAEDGLGELRVDICRLTNNDGARASFANDFRDFHKFGWDGLYIVRPLALHFRHGRGGFDDQPRTGLRLEL